MKRLFIVYNPYSSQYRHVKTDILDSLQELEGYLIGKYAIKKIGFEKNVATFAKLIKDDDLVVAAGGDATAAIAANAILKSGKNAILSALPYGNFNDLAHTLRTLKFNDVIKDAPTIKNLYPFSIYVDGNFWRYSTCYVTIGMTAECVKLFDSEKVRKELQKGHKSSWRSYFYLAAWYFKNRHKKTFLSEFSLNGQKQPSKTSDYAAINGRYMCRVMKGREDYLNQHTFRHKTDSLTNFFHLFRLMVKSIFYRVPGEETKSDSLDFLNPSTVEIQAEGESAVFKDIHKIEIKKEQKCLRVIQN